MAFFHLFCVSFQLCELFFTKELPCFTLQDIFISGEVLVLAFLSDPSNLWLDIFCSRYGFFSFVLSLISTVCELFFTKEVPCFTLQDIFISGEVLVLAFLSDPSNLWLDIFCSRNGFFSFVLSLISTVCELFFTKEVPCFTLQDIFIFGEVLVLAFLSDPSNLWLDIFCSRYGFLGGLSLHLNHLIALHMTIYDWPFGTLLVGLFGLNLDTRDLETYPRTYSGHF